MRSGVVLLAAGVAMGCSPSSESAPVVPAVAVTTQLSSFWELFPHRISNLELAFHPDPDQRGGLIRAQNDGGPLAALDTGWARHTFTVYQGDALRVAEGSVNLEIPATGSISPEDFVAQGQARVDAAPLSGAGPLVAWIRGYRISTNDYASPPAFVDDPVLPYDPAEGFTTQGLAIALGDAALEAGNVVVPVSVRNSLGVADRADMNAAIPRASSWIRVDLVVVGVAGAASQVTTESISYTTSTAAYGMNTPHPHAAESLQQIELQGQTPMASGLLGIKSFDIWLNAPGHIDPSCSVVQDPINSWDEPVSGPGRYVTELSVRLWDVSYAADTGSAAAKLDLFLSNTSTVKEIGNLCLGYSAEASLLQTAASISVMPVSAIDVELIPGGLTERQVRFDE